MSNIPTVRFLDRSTPPHIVTLILIAGISALNMSIFLPSLTAMTDYFQTDYATMQFALSGYLAMTAALQILIGPISDKVRTATCRAWITGDFRDREHWYIFRNVYHGISVLPHASGRSGHRHSSISRCCPRYGPAKPKTKPHQ